MQNGRAAKVSLSLSLSICSSLSLSLLNHLPRRGAFSAANPSSGKRGWPTVFPSLLLSAFHSDILFVGDFILNHKERLERKRDAQRKREREKKQISGLGWIWMLKQTAGLKCHWSGWDNYLIHPGHPGSLVFSSYTIKSMCSHINRQPMEADRTMNITC